MPYAPLGCAPDKLGWLPSKSRSSMEYLRAKFHLATG
jgi:hypothetical protein